MLPRETADTIPENTFTEQHETISSIEKTPTRSFHDRMRRDPYFRDWVEGHQSFKAHNMSFKFSILEGNQPKSSQAYKISTGTGYVFKSPDHTIRSTPHSIIIDINLDLGAASIDDLNLKYSQLAQSQVYKFAEKHHITLGGISKYREAHFTLKDNPLAKIISDRDEFKTDSGLQINKNHSPVDIEMREETARAMEKIMAVYYKFM